MDSERGFGHGSLWKKGKKYQLLSKAEKKKKSQGDIDLTHYSFLHRCVERQYEESEYFVHGWGNIISNWHDPQRLCQISYDSEKRYLEELQILTLFNLPSLIHCHSELGWYLYLSNLSDHHT